MAVIANDSPAQEKVSPAANIPVITNNSPAQEEGFSTDKSKKFFEPCDVDQDSDKKPLPPPEVTTETPDLLTAQKKRKKRRQRKRKSKKIKAVVAIRGPRAKHGIFSGKFHLKLPKRAIGNRLLVIALCSFLHHQLAHSALLCMTSVPVSDVPIILKHNNQNFILQKPAFCPDEVHIFDSCTACFRDKSQLEIVCRNVMTIHLWVQHGEGYGDGTLVRMTPGDCKHFVKKSHQHWMKRSEQLSPKVHPKDICSIDVPVTDPPVVIAQDDHRFLCNEDTFCPKREDIGRSCAACFKNHSMLEISCRKPGDGDYGLLWVEHGKGQGLSSLVDMNSEECQKIENNASKKQAERSDGETSTKDTEGGSKGTSWPDSRLFMIPVIFSVTFTSGFV